MIMCLSISFDNYIHNFRVVYYNLNHIYVGFLEKVNLVADVT